MISEINTSKPIFDKIEAEMDRQDAKWGDQRKLPSDLWCTILMEEVGEFAHACLEKDVENAKEEAVQVAALAVQILKSIEAYGLNR